MIQAVTGILNPDAITFCQCHEHLLLSKGVAYTVDPALCLPSYEKSLLELQDYRRAGGSTIVEAQPVGCNRMAEGLLRLSREGGVAIIASTGFHKSCFYPAAHWIHTCSWEELAQIYLQELTQGMYTDADTALPSRTIDAKAGVIKAALDKEFSPLYEKQFQAAAFAQTQTGAPMLIHVEMGSDPVSLFSFLSQLGVPADAMIFCHMDRSCPDLSQHRYLLEQGAYLEYDTIGRFKYHSDAYEAELIRQVVQWGFEKQLLFSLDTTALRLKHYTPQAIGLTYILDSFLPLLRESGISQEAIHRISRLNCISALSWKPRTYHETEAF